MQPGWIDQPHQYLKLGDFPLENGDVMQDAFLCYVIHGEINSAKSNAVLGLSAIGSNHHRLDFLIGDGMGLDSRDMAIVCVDALGNGLSSSPSNSEAQCGLAFPRFTIRDMVHAQKALMDHLQIRKWKAIAGTSMGGMQALQWGVSYPSSMDAILALTPMAKTSPWSAAVNAAARAALTADPLWGQVGHSSAGIPAWIAVMQLLSGRTPASLDSDFASAAAVQSWLDQRLPWQLGQGTHPVDWVYQSYAYDAHDVGTSPGFSGDTDAALASIKARVLVMAPPLDLYNPSSAGKHAALKIPGAKFVEIPSVRGHQSASSAVPSNGVMINEEVRSFLSTVDS